MANDLTWTALQWPGMEHAIVSGTPDGFRADSEVLLTLDAGPARISYLLQCDSAWQVTELTIKVVRAGSERNLVLSAAGDGHWLADHRPLASLDGCVDVDISCTPLTNTLPIRRLGGSRSAVHDLMVVYVDVPALEVSAVRQRYTLLEPRDDHDQALFRYESGTFRADVLVDAEGFVVDYPGIWRRVWPGSGASR